MKHNFLVEIGTEELPPTSLKSLSDALLTNVTSSLSAANIQSDDIKAYATPRRLALLVSGLNANAPSQEDTVWGPPTKIGFDSDGNPTKAANAFAKKNNLTVAELTVANDGKQEKLTCTVISGGEPVVDLLGDIVRGALLQLPIKKRMRWGASRNEFVRPVQWLVMLWDDQVLPETLLGIAAGKHSRGHRFHANHPIEINDASQYKTLLLEQGKVMVDFEERKNNILQQVKAAAKTLNGEAVIDDDLLEEVTALVEWPVALAGNFDKTFLSVPSEALISSMKEHQKYFHVVDQQGELIPSFITVANIVSKDQAQVISGNERVIRPRLADAAFFYETDKKVSLESRREKLKQVTFQAKLGSLFDKTERIKRLAGYLCEQLDLDPKHTQRAAELCKSDLVSNMVSEFSDMQGIAGSHYARNDNEHESVALAMVEQYQPKFAGDTVPAHDVGAIIALADRIDTITGIFGIGQKPSGSKDPFGLRRASLGALRIIVERAYDIDFKTLLAFAADGFASLPKHDTVSDEVLDYCLERFRAWFQEEGIAAEVFYSVQTKNLSKPLDIRNRVHAVATFTKLCEAQPLAEANKRVSNILAKQKNQIIATVNPDLFVQEQEKALFKALQAALKTVTPLFENKKYEAALKSLAILKTPVDNFFDEVMVMTEDEALKNNRLALLTELRNVFLEVADISLLVVKK